MKNLKTVIFTGVLLILTAGLWADVPDFINYQGRAYDNTGTMPVPDSAVNFINVNFYDVSTGGTSLWGTTINNVETKNGLFTIKIGPLGSSGLSFDRPYWIGIDFNGDGEMTPRHELASAPYSGRSSVANKISTDRMTYGPVTLTNTSGADEAVLTVSNTGTGILAYTHGSVSYVAGVAGMAYGLDKVGIYGWGEQSTGVMGETDGLGGTGVQGGADYGIGVMGRGVTGVAAIGLNYTDIGLWAQNNSGGVAVNVPQGQSLFYGAVTINAGGASQEQGALNVYTSGGAWAAAAIRNDAGNALLVESGDVGWPIPAAINARGNGMAYGLYAEGTTAVAGIGVTGVAGISNSWEGTGVYAENTSGGKSLYVRNNALFINSAWSAPLPFGRMGEIAVLSNHGSESGVYINNVAGTGLQVYGGPNGPMDSMGYAVDVRGNSNNGMQNVSGLRAIGFGIGSSGLEGNAAGGGTGVLGTGDIGVAGQSSALNGIGVSAVNESAAGTDTGAALDVKGKIKVNGAGTADSPAGQVFVQAGLGPPYVVPVVNNLADGIYRVFITANAQLTAGGGQTRVTYWVEKMAGQFVLHVDSESGPLDNDVWFDYLIINQ